MVKGHQRTIVFGGVPGWPSPGSELCREKPCDRCLGDAGHSGGPGRAISTNEAAMSLAGLY